MLGGFLVQSCFAGVGKYLEGGKEAGGQLVDQRFCPRIVEGELRYNMIGDSLIGVIHKKPKESQCCACSRESVSEQWTAKGMACCHAFQ